MIWQLLFGRICLFFLSPASQLRPKHLVSARKLLSSGAFSRVDSINQSSTTNGIAVAFVATTGQICLNRYSTHTSNITTVTSFSTLSGEVSLSRGSYSSEMLVLGWQDAAGPSVAWFDLSAAAIMWSTPTR
jgi:hypothetical protein